MMQQLEQDVSDSVDNILLKQQLAKELYSYKDQEDIVTYNKVTDVVVVGDSLEYHPSRIKLVVLNKFQVETNIKDDFPYIVNNSGSIQSRLRQHISDEINSVKCIAIMHEAKLKENTVYTQAYSLSNDEYMDISIDS
jgi:hypothetical protein